LPTNYTPGAKVGKRKLPDTYNNSPLSRFSGTDVETNLDHFHPFGSPVYVLEASLQALKLHNKWLDRARVGIFMWHSPHHMSSVPLVLNTQTGNISSQFHCIYDDDFSTCKCDAKFKSLWQYKAKLQSKLATTDMTDQLPTTVSHPYEKHGTSTPSLPLAADPVPRFIGSVPCFVELWDQPTQADDNPPNLEDANEPPIDKPTEDPVEAIEEPADEPLATTTRSGRRVMPRKRPIATGYLAVAAYLNTFSPLPADASALQLLQPDIEAHAEPHPFAFLTKHVKSYITQSDPDTMHLEEALQQPDREEFIKAMTKELNDHISRKHWKVMPAKNVPKHKIPIPMVWSMKRKRNPIGEILKWKARLCAGGHRSLEYIDYWSTYLPVVSWHTVRLLIVMALLNDWHMQSIDFVLAYPQAPIKTDIYMRPPRMPQNFVIPYLPPFADRFTNVYKLLRNLYGLKDAGKTWFDFLKKGLVERRWKPPAISRCLFTKDGIMLIVYVDDAILISPYKSLIHKEIKSLQLDYDLIND
jgi:hypothetical protein